MPRTRPGHPPPHPAPGESRVPPREATPAEATARLVAGRLPGPRSLLLAFAAGALGLAAVTDQPAHRVWGLVAGAGYLLLAVTPAARRPHAPWIAGALCGLVPLAVLVLARGGAAGPGPFAQPEVWVIEDAARRLLATGSAYPSPAETAAAPGPDGYFPYLPGMALFGLPRAVLGDAWWTDARLAFAAVAVGGCVLGTRALAGSAGPGTGAGWLLAGNPLVTLTLATGGHDLALAGLLVAAVGLAHLATSRDACTQTPTRGGWAPPFRESRREGARVALADDPRAVLAAGALAGLAAGTKPTAWPVVVVLLVLVAGTGGRRPALRFAGAAAGPALLLALPDLLRAPRLVLEHLVVFPAGLAAVPTPAAGPAPGVWLAALPGGRALALALLLAAVVIAAGWLLARPPADGVAAARFAAAGLTAGMLLAPSSRVGWFVVPLLLAGAAWWHRRDARGARRT